MPSREKGRTVRNLGSIGTTAGVVVLGTDGFGRSDYRVKLRSFFEVDRYHVTVAALKALADEGTVEPTVVARAIERFELDTEPRPPWKR